MMEGRSNVLLYCICDLIDLGYSRLWCIGGRCASGCGLVVLIPSGGCSHLPLHLHQLGDQCCPPVGDPSSGDRQQTDHQGGGQLCRKYHQRDDLTLTDIWFEHSDINFLTKDNKSRLEVWKNKQRTTWVHLKSKKIRTRERFTEE